MRKNNWTDDRDPGDEDRSEHGKVLLWVTPGERVELVPLPVYNLVRPFGGIGRLLGRLRGRR